MEQTEKIKKLESRLEKATVIFNEQKQTISDLEQNVKDLQFQLSESNKTFDKLVNQYNKLKNENSSLELQLNLMNTENEKLVKRIEELKLELGKLSKDPFVDTVTSTLKKEKENNQISIEGELISKLNPTSKLNPINTMQNVIPSKIGIEHNNNDIIFQI